MLRRTFASTAAALALLSGCAMDGDMNGGAMAAGDGGMAMAADMTPEDKMNYTKMAASSDMFEIESSRVAMDKARNAGIKSMAQMLVRDHTNSSAQLMAAARASGVRPMAPMMMPMHKQMLAELRRTSMADFDRMWLTQQVKAHEMALALHSNYASSGDAQPLRTTAAAAAPAVEMHLAEARRMMQMM